MQKGLWIKTDGKVENVSSSGDEFSLDELQKYVGGYIQLVTTKDGSDMYLNEGGLIIGLPINRAASAVIHPKWLTAGGVRGNVIVVSR